MLRSLLILAAITALAAPALAAPRSIDCAKEGLGYFGQIMKGNRNLGRAHWVPKVGRTLDLEKTKNSKQNGELQTWNQVHLVTSSARDLREGVGIEVSFGGKVPTDVLVTVCQYLIPSQGGAYGVQTKEGRSVTLKQGTHQLADIGAFHSSSRRWGSSAYLIWLSPADAFAKQRAYQVRAKRNAGGTHWARAR